ncbi:MAG: T9SS type A sorting domain-containing protein [Nitrososphaerales archaeon]
MHSQEISFYYDMIVDSLSSQSDGGQLIDNLTRQIWNESSSSWINDSLYEHSYNGNNLIDTIIAHKWRNGSVWGNDGRWRYFYNSNNKLIQRFSEEWFTTYWREYYRNDYSYSGPNQNLTQISNYSPSNNNWALTSYTIYSWNPSNCLLSTTSYTLSTIFAWYYYAYWRYEYYYDSSNVLIVKTGFSSYHGSPWANEIKDLYYYDQNGNKNENIRQEWNSTNSIWVNDYRYLYEYDSNNNLISTIYQDWQLDSLDWMNVWRENYTYTPQNNIATMFRENWTLETGWNNYVLRTYFYDSNYNWVEKITFLWDESHWKNYYRHLATWIEPVSVWDTPNYLNDYYLSNNYPNPFNPSTKIKIKIPASDFVTLKVYDILGNEIAVLVNEEKPAGEYEIEFSENELPSGIYFYTLTSGNYSETKKMILMK